MNSSQIAIRQAEQVENSMQSANTTWNLPRRFSVVASMLAFLAIMQPTLTIAQNKEVVDSNADEAGTETGALKPFGQFVTISGQVDDDIVSRLTNLTREMQTRAVREKRQAILVLRIEPGTSRSGQVGDLARVLVSPELSKVRTVAWIPKTLDGNHVILALACHDIFMYPDASLGDIGRGAVVANAEQNIVLDIIDRGRNLRMSRAIAKAMMDPGSAVLKVTLEDREGRKIQRYLSAQELRELQNQNVVISETATIKDPGQPGLFSASEAKRAGFLVAGNANNNNEVAAALNLPLEAMREADGPGRKVIVKVIAVNNVVDKLLADFVERETQHAISDGANMIIYEIDSPGGDKQQTQHLAALISELDPAQVTTVAWIPEEATQAGAMIALGCDRIVMTRNAVLGNIDLKAMRVNRGRRMAPADGIEAEELQRITTLLKSIAKRKNRSASLVQAMVDPSQPVFEVTAKETGRVSWMNEAELAAQPDEWIKGPAVPEARGGELLVLTADRAHELGLAEAPCNDIEQLRTRLGIGASTDLRPVAKTWVDNLVTVLNSGVAGFLLITLGIVFIYLELHLPSGFFGIAAATTFSLFFWSRFLGGSAGGLELILFLLGMVLLGLEFFVVPGFGVFGVSGILMTLASLVMASNTFAGMTATESFEQSMSSLGSLAGALVTVIVVAVVLNRFLPSIPFINRLILTPPGYATQEEEGLRLNPSLLNRITRTGPIKVGMIGTTASSLRPTGKAMFGDKYVDVVSDGAYIDHDTRIEVIRLAGNRIIVRAALESDGTDEKTA